MRRLYGILATLTIAFAAVGLTPATAQNQPECCGFRVTHNFTLCLPQGCQGQLLQVIWNWNTKASAWQSGSLPIIDTNSGSQIYTAPSTDIRCAQAQITTGGQTCATSRACATFSVGWDTLTNCLRGSHTVFGSACAICRRHGANAAADSTIVIACPNIPQGSVIWTPQFQDSISGDCEAQIHDPVIIRYRNPSTGATREEVLFDLTASNFHWEPNPDGATARTGPKDRKTGHVTLLKGRSGSSESSRIHLRWDANMQVVESEATGEFAQWDLPNVGDRMPLYDEGGVRLPGVFELPFRADDGEVVAGIEMGGGGVSGQDIPRTPGDVDGNGCVDDADLLQVLFAFGGQGGAADVNGDGIVDDADLLIVLFNFGTGC